MTSEPTAPGLPASELSAKCTATELRSLFLFEKLSDDQLAWLCRAGRVQVVDPGLVYAEGEPAGYFYVLLSGTIALLRRIGAEDVEVVRGSRPGVYGGAFLAYLRDRVPQVYTGSMRALERSRFFVLDASTFADQMDQWFPMAVHLLEGLLFGTRNMQDAISQHERLLALGKLAAGLTHELNNPAAAAVRAAGALREQVAGVRGKLVTLAGLQPGGGILTDLIKLQNDVIERIAKAPPLSPVEEADLEDAVSGWMDAHDIADGWQLAPVFVQAGLGADDLDMIAAGTARASAESSALVVAGAPAPMIDDQAALTAILRWLAYAAETELLIDEVTESVGRISTLVGDVKQYSQLDRAPYQTADIHELLDSTLVMLSDKIGRGIAVVKDFDLGLPRIPCYPAELNQVWTNIIDNAIFAMGETGTLTIRTTADDDKLLVEVADTGPGIAADVRERIFEPFFTTKPPGEGSGLGLDISWRIIVQRHSGDLRVLSVPGDTRFQVRLPMAGIEKISK
jgi:signal transduction histidine kinase